MPALPCTRNLRDFPPGITRSGRQVPLRERSGTFPVGPLIKETRENGRGSSLEGHAGTTSVAFFLSKVGAIRLFRSTARSTRLVRQGGARLWREPGQPSARSDL